ncbi:MAG: hypothetical protein KAW52_08425 [candidate division Zixibacteria bacterium]|nr:hypothetical protein [candidate division Zixibacteria bacterium]
MESFGNSPAFRLNHVVHTFGAILRLFPEHQKYILDILEKTIVIYRSRRKGNHYRDLAKARIIYTTAYEGLLVGKFAKTLPS